MQSRIEHEKKVQFLGVVKENFVATVRVPVSFTFINYC